MTTGLPMTSDRFLIGWGYAVEVILVGVLYAGVLVIWSPQVLTAFVLGTAGGWASTTEVLLAASFAFLLAMFVNVMFTDFGEYLRVRRAALTYLGSYAFDVLIFLATTLVLKLTSWVKDWRVAHIAFLLLIYSCVNATTMVRNTIGLAELLLAHRASRSK